MQFNRTTEHNHLDPNKWGVIVLENRRLVEQKRNHSINVPN